MTTALRRKLNALHRLAERPGTAGEQAAAELAIERIRARLKGAGEAIEWPEQDTPYQDYTSHPGLAGAGQGVSRLLKGRSSIGYTLVQ